MKLGYEREKNRQSKPSAVARVLIGLGQSALAIALFVIIIYKVPQMAIVKETLVKIFEKMADLYQQKGLYFILGVIAVSVSVWFAINRERVEVHHKETIRQEIKKKALSDLLRDNNKGGK